MPKSRFGVRVSVSVSVRARAKHTHTHTELALSWFTHRQGDEVTQLHPTPALTTLSTPTHLRGSERQSHRRTEIMHMQINLLPRA